MPTYFDSSVAMAALLEESRSHEARQLLDSDDQYLISWLSLVEIRRNLARARESLANQFIRERFLNRIEAMLVATIDEDDWRLAAEIAETTLLKSLDALHLAVASNLELQNLTFLTFDKRQASVARQLGFSVVGA